MNLISFFFQPVLSPSLSSWWLAPLSIHAQPRELGVILASFLSLAKCPPHIQSVSKSCWFYFVNMFWPLLSIPITPSNSHLDYCNSILTSLLAFTFSRSSCFISLVKLLWWLFTEYVLKPNFPAWCSIFLMIWLQRIFESCFFFPPLLFCPQDCMLLGSFSSAADCRAVYEPHTQAESLSSGPTSIAAFSHRFPSWLPSSFIKLICLYAHFSLFLWHLIVFKIIFGINISINRYRSSTSLRNSSRNFL